MSSSLARARTIFGLELAHTFKRPLFWFLVGILVLTTWLFSTGSLTISSGDASVGGTKAWITSEFNFAFLLITLIAILYSFFGSIASGMAVISDDEARVGEILHSTSLRPGEYVWGKFLAIVAGFVAALGIHLLLAMFFNHLVPNSQSAEIRGPFHVFNYVRPVLIFALPALIFYLGAAFYLGERWRRPIAVFLFPTAVLLLCGFFLWDWAPTWLDPRINQALMMVDPAGFRWLNETWLKADRGATFYNTTPVGLDLPFVISRLAFLGLGLLGVYQAQRHMATHLQGEAVSEGGWRLFRRRSQVAAATGAVLPFRRTLSELGAKSGEVGLFRGIGLVASTELKNLLASPGLYLFGALILLQTLGTSLLALGAFQTEVLLTPGLTAVRSFNTLSLLLCLLLMFYTVESLERERSSGLSPISFSTPTRTASFLFGKAVANSLVGVVMIAATFLGCAIAILIQGKVGLSLSPYLIVWGLLLVPTLFLWTCFMVAVQSIGGQRYLTYGIGLGVIVLTFFLQFRNHMNWVWNWWLWSALQWSDLGLFEINRKALLLNRLLALSTAVLLVVVAVRAYGRRQADAIGRLQRLQPASFWRGALRLAPFALVPLVLGIVLAVAVQDGFQGGFYEKKAHDYWKQNLATWKDAPQPAMADADLDLKLAPERRWLHSRGSYELVNDRDNELRQFALTGGFHWRKLHWTLGGKPYKPENRTGLYVFTPPAPLKPGDRIRVGFDFEGSFPPGITKNGGGNMEFILPSGVVLTAFSPSFVPVVGYMEEIGKKDETNYETKVYPDDFYKGKTDVAFGVGHPLTTRIAVTGPADYTFNSVGVKESDTVAGGQRTVVWKSDYPVRLFNVVGGHWKVRRGQGTAIYYHPGHEYNLNEMISTLDAARRYYSEWFRPFPWRELKLSEFPGLAGYAQGFPTNITFSENIGFLTKSDVKTDAVFLVTAHESAHQWWGNLLTPGKGPGGDLLSEGMAHFSTALLFEQVKGPQARMEFMKRIEEGYGNSRRADAERPLVKIDGSHTGDTTVTYDKGGWVFWMMGQKLGRERMLAGLRKFMTDWGNGPDYPVLQDFTAAMRPFAPDPASYDDFVRQWFHQVVVPEYQLSGARGVRTPGGSWKVTVRVKNVGKGRMPVEVAAVRGERFAGTKGKPKPGYQDARATVVLGAGEERAVEIACAFQPEKVVVDPDVQVLQLRRKAAVAKL
ncbi:MAG TPA: M1 family aminopeptidase [Thermoanaerobaculia bacterium]|jgi:ABC-type transport system involved in multi-copper enzyme maturation permease subunit|nr:M1 family aminopeptidase [Thermoanaerobaculia bacterium]